MERLTTDSPKNMMEMLLNCGVIKDGEAYYRDFKQEISTREFIRKIISMYAQNEISNGDTLSDDDFDDILTDNLQYGETELIGVIALLYQALISVSELRERLKQYEDLEEQGKLLKLPCMVGDIVYAIEADEENFEHFYCGMKISELQFDYWMIPLFEKSIFLTKSAAEQALKEMEGKNANRINRRRRT